MNNVLFDHLIQHGKYYVWLVFMNQTDVVNILTNLLGDSVTSGGVILYWFLLLWFTRFNGRKKWSKGKVWISTKINDIIADNNFLYNWLFNKLLAVINIDDLFCGNLKTYFATVTSTMNNYCQLIRCLHFLCSVFLQFSSE